MPHARHAPMLPGVPKYMYKKNFFVLFAVNNVPSLFHVVIVRVLTPIE